jgi:hypothetical protein
MQQQSRAEPKAAESSEAVEPMTVILLGIGAPLLGGMMFFAARHPYSSWDMFLLGTLCCVHLVMIYCVWKFPGEFANPGPRLVLFLGVALAINLPLFARFFHYLSSRYRYGTFGFECAFFIEWLLHGCTFLFYFFSMSFVPFYFMSRSEEKRFNTFGHSLSRPNVLFRDQLQPIGNHIE